MAWKDMFGKGKKEKEIDPLADLTLAKLKKGYYLDYDMNTWQVEARHQYDWGGGDITHEWQLKSHDDTIYLSKETDDEDEWTISRKIPIGKIGSHVTDHIIEHEDPPDEITVDGVTYYLEESGGGHFYENGKSPGQQFISWDYEDDSGEKYLTIEQWSEEDFEASAGTSVEEYQFTNILPGEKETS